MKKSNLIPITRIYDIYPKYTYSDDVKKFMDEIVDIDRANVYTEDEVIAMLTELQSKVREVIMNNCLCESCCDKDFCLIYQDYKNPDGIVAEPITACGRYKKLHTVEDTYTKEGVSAISKVIQQKINALKRGEDELY